MKPTIHGRSAGRHYAVARAGDQAWREREAQQELYRPIRFDDIPEADWDRIEDLEQQMFERERAARKGE